MPYGAKQELPPFPRNGEGKEVRISPPGDDNPRYMTNWTGQHLFFPDQSTKSVPEHRVYWSQTELQKLGITTQSDGVYLIPDTNTSSEGGHPVSFRFQTSRLGTAESYGRRLFFISYGQQQLPIEHTFADEKPDAAPGLSNQLSFARAGSEADRKYRRFLQRGKHARQPTQNSTDGPSARGQDSTWKRRYAQFQTLCAFVRFCKDGEKYDHPLKEYFEVLKTQDGSYNFERVLTHFFFPHQIKKLRPSKFEQISVLQCRDTMLYFDALRSRQWAGVKNNIATKLTMAFMGLPVEPLTDNNLENIGFDTHDNPTLLESDETFLERVAKKKFPLEFLDCYARPLHRTTQEEPEDMPDPLAYRIPDADVRDLMAYYDLDPTIESRQLSRTRPSSSSDLSSFITRLSERRQFSSRDKKSAFAGRSKSSRIGHRSSSLRGGTSASLTQNRGTHKSANGGNAVSLRGGAVIEEIFEEDDTTVSDFVGFEDDETAEQDSDEDMPDAYPVYPKFASSRMISAAYRLRGGGDDKDKDLFFHPDELDENNEEHVLKLGRWYWERLNPNDDFDVRYSTRHEQINYGKENWVEAIAAYEPASDEAYQKGLKIPVEMIKKKADDLMKDHPGSTREHAEHSAFVILGGLDAILTFVPLQDANDSANGTTNGTGPGAAEQQKERPDEVVELPDSEYESADEPPMNDQQLEARIEELIEENYPGVTKAHIRTVVEMKNDAAKLRSGPDPKATLSLLKSPFNTVTLNTYGTKEVNALRLQNFELKQEKLGNGTYCYFCDAMIFTQEPQDHFRGHVARPGECAWCGLDMQHYLVEQKRAHIRLHKDKFYRPGDLSYFTDRPRRGPDTDSEEVKKENGLLLYCSGCGFDLDKIQTAAELIEHAKGCPDGYHITGNPKFCKFCAKELESIDAEGHVGVCRGENATTIYDPRLQTIANNYAVEASKTTVIGKRPDVAETYKALLALVNPSIEGGPVQCKYASCSLDIISATKQGPVGLYLHLKKHMLHGHKLRQDGNVCHFMDCKEDLSGLTDEGRDEHARLHFAQLPQPGKVCLLEDCKMDLSNFTADAVLMHVKQHFPEPTPAQVSKTPELSKHACHFPGCTRTWGKKQMIPDTDFVKSKDLKMHWSMHFNTLKPKNIVHFPSPDLKFDESAPKNCAWEDCELTKEGGFHKSSLAGPKGQAYWKWHTQTHFRENEFEGDKRPYSKNPLEAEGEDSGNSAPVPQTPKRVENKDIPEATKVSFAGSEGEGKQLTEFLNSSSPGMYTVIPKSWREAINKLPLPDIDDLDRNHFSDDDIEAFRGASARWVFMCRACGTTMQANNLWNHRTVKQDGTTHNLHGCKHDDDRQWAIITNYLLKWYQNNLKTLNPTKDVYLECPIPGLYRTFLDVVTNEEVVREHLIANPPTEQMRARLPNTPAGVPVEMNLGNRRNDGGQQITTTNTPLGGLSGSPGTKRKTDGTQDSPSKKPKQDDGKTGEENNNGNGDANQNGDGTNGQGDNSKEDKTTPANKGKKAKATKTAKTPKAKGTPPPPRRSGRKKKSS